MLNHNPSPGWAQEKHLGLNQPAFIVGWMGPCVRDLRHMFNWTRSREDDVCPRFSHLRCPHRWIAGQPLSCYGFPLRRDLQKQGLFCPAGKGLLPAQPLLSWHAAKLLRSPVSFSYIKSPHCCLCFLHPLVLFLFRIQPKPQGNCSVEAVGAKLN